MNWIEQVTILDLLLKGLIIGIVVSAPLGPVGVLCIQRTLNKGRWFGFVTGVGAALSDICYALITGYGMSFMDELILKHHIFLQVVGSIMLLAFGIYTFRSNPVKSLRPASGTRGTYLHNFVTAFLSPCPIHSSFPVHRSVCPFLVRDAGQSHRLPAGRLSGHYYRGIGLVVQHYVFR